MALADALKSGPPRSHKGPACSVGLTLGLLPKGEAVAFRSMLNDDAWGHTEIDRALRDEGIRLGRHSLMRHRNGDCSCEARGLR